MDVGAFQVGSHIDLLHGDEDRLEGNLAVNQVTQFSPQEFVDPFETMLHGEESESW